MRPANSPARRVSASICRCDSDAVAMPDRAISATKGSSVPSRISAQSGEATATAAMATMGDRPAAARAGTNRA